MVPERGCEDQGMVSCSFLFFKEKNGYKVFADNNLEYREKTDVTQSLSSNRGWEIVCKEVVQPALRTQK